MEREIIKTGQIVSLRLDPNVLAIVSLFNGNKCLKIPTTMGWRYIEPIDWNDVIFKP